MTASRETTPGDELWVFCRPQPELEPSLEPVPSSPRPVQVGEPRPVKPATR